MKLKSLEEEVACLTYTKEACTELEKIRMSLLEKTESVHTEVGINLILIFIKRCFWVSSPTSSPFFPWYLQLNLNSIFIILGGETRQATYQIQVNQ